MKKLLLCLLIATNVQAADWPACKAGKLDALKLEEALRQGGVLRGYRDRSDMRSELRELDRWLWKQCRRFSSEMRDLSVAYR